MGYVFVTIIDCYYRPGFIVTSRQKQHYGQNSELIKGGIIGWVAALLGVGGSVMTVPLLRRRGSSMAEAAAIANILTLPLSLTATFTYCVLSIWQSTWVPKGFIGLIWFEAALFLVAGTWIGLYFSEKFISLHDSIDNITLLSHSIKSSIKYFAPFNSIDLLYS